MKYILILILATTVLKVNAQVIVCITQKVKGNNKDIIFAHALLNPNAQYIEDFGFIIRSNKPVLRFNCVDTQDSLPNLKNVDLAKSVVVIKLDNDSLMYFHPKDTVSMIQYKPKMLEIDVEADITNEQLNIFNNHKLISLRLVTDTLKRYDIFIFTQQNKIDIQRATDCFLSKLALMPQ